MAFHDLSFLEIVCCPHSEERLIQVEPWLYSSSDFLYPRLCQTPVLQPRIDDYLLSEISSISRGLAEFSEKKDIEQWFFSRYNLFNPPDPSPMDTAIPGEGYPGFWESMAVPDFVRDLTIATPESMIIDAIGDVHPQLGLDLACGQGGMTQMMARVCNHVLGLERNFYLACTANRFLNAEEIPIRYFIPEKGDARVTLKKRPAHNTTVICGDIHKMPFCEPLFDWIHCGHILDLIDDPAEVLIQIKRILKPGGTLSICTPWDFHEAGSFDSLMEILSTDFKETHFFDGVPWLRFHHKRRFILHEDWIWIGKLNNENAPR